MTDMVTINNWTVDLDDFDYKTFFVGTEKKTVVIDGEETEQDRYIYDHDSYYKALGLKQKKSQREHKGKIIATFAKHGIVTAEIIFSGGNDSGGADESTFYDADGNVVDIDTNYVSVHQYVDGKHSERELTVDAKESNNFIALIEAPIDWRWGSFAGDFSVSGTLRYNINNGEYCEMEYEESSYEYHKETF